MYIKEAGFRKNKLFTASSEFRQAEGCVLLMCVCSFISLHLLYFRGEVHQLLTTHEYRWAACCDVARVRDEAQQRTNSPHNEWSLSSLQDPHKFKWKAKRTPIHTLSSLCLHLPTSGRRYESVCRCPASSKSWNRLRSSSLWGNGEVRLPLTSSTGEERKRFNVHSSTLCF